MKINVWNSIGDYSQSLDVEYNSECGADCIQAEKYIMAVISAYAEVKDEVEVDADP